jgi:hypothetical protein
MEFGSNPNLFFESENRSKKSLVFKQRNNTGKSSFVLRIFSSKKREKITLNHALFFDVFFTAKFKQKNTSKNTKKIRFFSLIFHLFFIRNLSKKIAVFSISKNRFDIMQKISSIFNRFSSKKIP